MVTYIYFVKCPDCEDEYFDFFDEAKEFALSCLSKKPIITQTEVCRNDFGECTDHSDLGTVWSWEDECRDTEGGYTEANPTISIFTKDDLKRMAHGEDPEFDALDNSVDFEVDEIPDNFRKPMIESFATNEFEIPGFEASVVDEFEDEGVKGYNIIYSKNGTDIVEVEVWEADAPVTVNDNLYAPNLMDHSYDSFEFFSADLNYKVGRYVKECFERKPIPEGMTIEQLVEEMEENEDTVECTKCGNLVEKASCHHNNEGFGWCCTDCESEDLHDLGNEYDGGYPAENEEVLVETSLSDIAAAANSEFGSNYNERDFLDRAGVEDMDYFDDLETAAQVSAQGYRNKRRRQAYAIERDKAKKASQNVNNPNADSHNNHLVLCPECGFDTLNLSDGICINCGFDSLN